MEEIYNSVTLFKGIMCINNLFLSFSDDVSFSGVNKEIKKNVPNLVFVLTLGAS